ncbi:pentatricopeptide repeat-containing protein At1g32415, mitochondrial [Mercurialis annua]|uniref:pentatricopeptide repeat-containing protein At1g32415, mitochondrial n=1 Tax=Mercurialis annua TaxID=3986 RepID=UPI00215EE335|nr:pentatricopeptide repeat-containing protein At1g32415, mitochondrial [Mercurialis annua]
MRAFCCTALKFSIPTNSLNFSSKFFPFLIYRSESSNTHIPELTFNDYQLLSLLSQRRFRDARNLLDEMPERSVRLIVYWTSLLTKFSRNGFVDEAEVLFDIMPERNIVTYNAMLSGFLHCGMLGEAMKLFDEMPERNVVSWTSMMCGLADAGRIFEAIRLFEEMPERNVVSWNAMIAGLIRNGGLEYARAVFDESPLKNVVSWNTVIAGYAEKGRMEEARALFDEMEDKNVITWTSMVSGYCRTGKVEEGYSLFLKTPKKNVVSWTAMIGGFTWNGLYEDALLLFLEMEKSFDITPNVETFISLAYAFAGLGIRRLSKQLHTRVISTGLECDDYDGRLLKSLIYMYSSLGFMDYARYKFNQNSNCSVQSCNYMINGYIRSGQLDKARNLFDTTPIRDEITWTSMIDGYFSVGNAAEACNLFHHMPEKDAVAWTTMISGHVQNELLSEAMFLFTQMLDQGVSPLGSTFATLLGAVGAVASLDQGTQLHGLLVKMLLENDLILENSLISMYAKCGEIQIAYKLFSQMNSRDLISWNSMIMGFSHHGLANEALKVFEAMLDSGTFPNSVTFLGVLSACSHGGLINQWWELFNAMIDIYAIQPSLEHYICMVNLLGRAGKLNEAEELILKLPMELNHAIWGALLGLCSFSEKNSEIAERAATRILEMDPLNAPAHVLLCNVYAANGRHIEEHKLRKEMGSKGVKKIPGCSWIVLNGRTSVFLSGDKMEAETTKMLSLLFHFVDESQLSTVA